MLIEISMIKNVIQNWKNKITEIHVDAIDIVDNHIKMPIMMFKDSGREGHVRLKSNFSG